MPRLNIFKNQVELRKEMLRLNTINCKYLRMVFLDAHKLDGCFSLKCAFTYILWLIYMTDYMSDQFDCMSVSTDIRSGETLEALFHLSAKTCNIHIYCLLLNPITYYETHSPNHHFTLSLQTR